MSYFKYGARFYSSALKWPGRLRTQSGISILTYHEVLEDELEVDSWMVVRGSHFERQMRYLKTHYDVLGIEEALHAAKNWNNNKRNIRGIVAVTFDDGYAGICKTVLPVMRELNLPFTLFCATGAIESQRLYWYDEVISALLANKDKFELSFNSSHPENYRINGKKRGERKWNEIQRLLTRLKKMPKIERNAAVICILKRAAAPDNNYPIRSLSIQELQEIAQYKLATIGAHSHSHEILVQLTAEDAKKDVLTSIHKLRDWIGKRVDYFSYPNGDYNGEIQNVIRDMGFKGAFTTEERKWNSEMNDFSIPRIGIGRFDSFGEFIAKLCWVL